MKTRVAILDDDLGLSQKLADWSAVARRSEIVVMGRHIGPDEAAVALAEFDVICTLRERLPFPRSLIEKLPRLRHLCVTGKRYDTVDVNAAAERGVVVSNTPVAGVGAGAVAELTWGLIIGAARSIPLENASMRSGGWQTRAGNTLRGKQLGVVGLGAIGADVARLGIAFGMDVVAWSPNLTEERARACGVRAVAKRVLFATSDVVTLHLALYEATRAIVAENEVSAMRETALLVNTARAGLVDGTALRKALTIGRIRAALDVYEIEPLPADDPLRGLENVLLTPHLGYVTREMLTTYYRFAVENVSAFLDGTPIRVVNSAN